jgi:hypothetical protein
VWLKIRKFAPARPHDEANFRIATPAPRGVPRARRKGGPVRARIGPIGRESPVQWLRFGLIDFHSQESSRQQLQGPGTLSRGLFPAARRLAAAAAARIRCRGGTLTWISDSRRRRSPPHQRAPPSTPKNRGARTAWFARPFPAYLQACQRRQTRAPARVANGINLETGDFPRFPAASVLLTRREPTRACRGARRFRRLRGGSRTHGRFNFRRAHAQFPQRR